MRQKLGIWNQQRCGIFTLQIYISTVGFNKAVNMVAFRASHVMLNKIAYSDPIKHFQF